MIITHQGEEYTLKNYGHGWTLVIHSLDLAIDHIVAALATAKADAQVLANEVRRLNKICAHMSEEIDGQLTHGELTKEDLSTMFYWRQVSDCGHCARKDRPADVTAALARIENYNGNI